MNGKNLLNGLSYIDEILVDEAERQSIKKPDVKWLISIAASFAIVVAAVSLFSHDTSMLDGGNETGGVSEEGFVTAEPGGGETEKFKLYFNRAENELAASLVIKGHFWEELTQLQAEKLLPGLAQKYQTEGTVHYSHQGGSTAIFSIGTSVNVSGKAVKITMAPNEVVKCYMILGKPVLSEIEGVKIEAGIFTTAKNSEGEQNHIYYANFKLEDVAYYVEYSGEEADEEFFTNIIANIILGGKADLSAIENPVVPELRDEELTEKEAYAEPDFGAYLPKAPSGYKFNNSTRFINQDRNCLFASWSQGYEDIQITISKLNEQDKDRIVSISDTSLYDMSLYPIPWAESMPRDKAHIIENPIFKIEDLTSDSLKMREYIRSEQNDPGGNSVNMRFTVRYADILVEVATEGIGSQALFDELSKLPQNQKS